MLFFHGKNGFQQPARGRILVIQILNKGPVTVDGDAFRNQVFLDHIEQRRAFQVFSMTASCKAMWRKIRFTAQLDNTLRQLIGVP